MKLLHKNALEEIGWANIRELRTLPEWKILELGREQPFECRVIGEGVDGYTKFNAIYERCYEEFKNLRMFDLEWIEEEARKRGDK